MRRLSSERIESFVGNVLPLRLLGGEAYGMEKITWRLDGDCVKLKKFTDAPNGVYDDGDFTDGVLLTFVNPGTALVTATNDGVDYTCRIISRARTVHSSDETWNYYVGDMHIHTSHIHNRDRFCAREDGSSPRAAMEMMKDEGKLDFAVITDHSDMLNRKEFFRAFAEAEDLQPMAMEVFPGSECDIFSYEKDRYGVMHNHANEVVCINAETCVAAESWQEFLDGYAGCPNIVCVLAHPNLYGYNVSGKGDFQLIKNSTPRFRQMVKFIEMGDGSDRSGNLLHEYLYSVALDNGFRISPACNSDSHGPVWGYERFPGKTILMAKDNTRESYLDAMLNNRAYASCSGNVKLRYSVNGFTAPAVLPYAEMYHFHVEISYFHDDPTTVPVKCQVISDGGFPVKEIEGVDFSDFEFDVESDRASWFYLRLWDEEGRKTWSPAIWTGREPYQTHTDDLIPLCKTGFSAVDEDTGKDASAVLCEDPHLFWSAEGKTCSILIDMQEEKTIGGLGHYPRVLLGQQMKETGRKAPEFLAEFPCHYVISTSLDGKQFTKKAEGWFRTFGAEDIIRLENHQARYIRLEVLSTIGRNSHRKDFVDANVSIGELTPYQKYEAKDLKAYVASQLEKRPNPLL